MTIDTNNMLESILQSLSRIDYIKPEDIPNIDLYMDQVLTYMHRQLSLFERSEDNPLLTSSMINNYVKSGVLERPEKKKYSKNHLATLMVICMLAIFLKPRCC